MPWDPSFVGAVRRTPGLWSVGLVGALVRGGFVALLVPMLALPSPVGLSVLIGPDLVDANGLSTRVAAMLVVAGGLGLLALGAGLVTAALADIAAYRGLLRAAGLPARSLDRWSTVRLAAGLLGLQLVAAVPLLIALVPTTATLAELTRQEILLPTDQRLPLWARVVEGAWPELAVVAAMTLLTAHLYTILGRELLARRCAAGVPVERRGLVGLALAAMAALVRRPLRTWAASGLAWAGALLAALVAGALVTVGWTVVQAVYLSPAPAGATPLVVAASWLAMVAGTVMLVGLLGLALAVLGVAAALRSAVLTQAVLGGRGPA